MKIKILLLMAFAYLAQTAIAETKIHEVQPYPASGPEVLVIWGTDFNDPSIYFGTHLAPLNISADQSQCAIMTANPAPPLDPMDFDCIVVDLPVVDNGVPNVPSGDYLLKIFAEGGMNVCGDTKPSSLTFLYQPKDCSGFNSQTDASCSGNMTGSIDAPTFTFFDKDADKWSASQDGDLVTFTSSGDKWGNKLSVLIDDGTFSQEVSLHTSCSQPLVLGEEFGSLELMDFIGNGGTTTMQMDLYDLTLGAVGPEGPQGDPGPKGDTGDQGPQGVQGKLGDTGAQGVQGKVGDTGAQGVQGKVGDTGAQGVQGVQGKKGDTGDDSIVPGPQGVQGKKGDTGADGSDGIGTNIMCFAGDQTVSTGGKFTGLGQQAGDHDSVGVISPFDAGALVVKLVAKAAQGGSGGNSGIAVLHNDAGPLSSECVLLGDPTSSTCSIPVTGTLTELDSLSIFFKTDGGSWAGVSACILVDPDGI